jgi:uncharacterized membrane protein
VYPCSESLCTVWRKMQDTHLVPVPVVSQETRSALWGRKIRAWFWNGRTVPYLYLAVSLPTILLLCWLVPPLQTNDESRHFMRACQIAQGDLLPAIDPVTGHAGGMVPAALGDFVRQRMDSKSLLAETALRTMRARMNALDRAADAQPALANKRFVSFPSSAIYAPALYLPQAAGIRVAQLFSDKVYSWLYCGRVFNSVCAVLLIFLALRTAPQQQLLLLLPAMLPVSLYQIASLSSDAEIIALSILFVALCLRFLTEDTWTLRLGLVICLVLLTMGKPVHLVLGLLLLAAYEQIGWRRALAFCSMAMGMAASSYIGWCYLVRRFMGMAGEDHGQNPAAQIHFIVTNAGLLPAIVYRSFRDWWQRLFLEIVGLFGWQELPLPPWFYVLATGFAVTVIVLVLLNRKKIVLSRFLLGSLAAVGLAAAVLLAAYVLWTPPGYPRAQDLNAKYFLPILPILAFIAPPLSRFTRSSRNLLALLSVGFLVLSAYSTVRIVDHYYFPRSALLGKNIHSLFEEVHDRSCPVSITSEIGRGSSWFGYLASGRAAARDFRVVLATDQGVILGESDPALAGSDFPYVLLPGSSRRKWRIHVWSPRDGEGGQLWLVVGRSACSFGEKIEFKPVPIPELSALEAKSYSSQDSRRGPKTDHR